MLRRMRWPMGLAVLAWIVVGFSLPALVGRVYGVRDPQGLLVHDEHCYLLQADTFAAGRLTNPSPAHPEFFETPHVLVVPSYQSKYPPAQAVCLAFGLRYFGHPIYGVWLSCGLFAAALYWMLSGWLNRTWALVGTLHGVGILGITTYWAQSYWGGMVSATGGALVLGGTMWTLRRWRPEHGFWTGLGATILLCSRPFEGGVLCLGCAPVLGQWLWSGTNSERIEKLKGWCVPFLLVLLMGASALATYNRAVTGSWTKLPYAVYHRQYFTCGLFRWQPLDQEPERHVASRLRLYFEGETCRPGTPGGPRAGFGPIAESAFGAILKLPGQFLFHFKFLAKTTPSLSLTRGLEIVLIGLYLGLFSASLWKTPHWGRVQAAHALLVCSALAGSLVWWKALHYRAPFVVLFFFLGTDALRRVTVVFRRRGAPSGLRLSTVTAGLSLALLTLIPFTWMLWGSDIGHAESVAISPTTSGRPLSRPELLRTLAKEPNPVLAFVSCDEDVSLHDEWVYNLSDLASQRVVLAHDLGAERNRLLVADFPNRDVWQVRVTRAGAVLTRDTGR